MDLLLCGIGKQTCKVLHHALEGFLGGTLTPTGILAQLPFGRREQCPSEAILVAVAVGRVDKVFSDDAAGHLQARHVVVEL